jgi:hypothetical protein
LSSFDTLRVKVGRRPITVVELDLDFCQNVYGVSPCTALIPDTGDQKCFNTFKTCQDTPNYVRGTKTYKFCSNTSFLPIGEMIYPCITDIDIAPTQLKPEAISVSASVTMTFQDFPDNDRGTDPYVTERAYDPEQQGTFFGKLRARNPYLVGRVVRLSTGYIDSDRVIYSQSRTYLIDHMEGPDANGRVRLIGKDPLKFTEGEKAKVPVPSNGTLSVDLTIDGDALGLLPVGVADTYPSSGLLRIEDELVTYSGKNGDVLTGLVRGYGGTTAAEHDAEEKVQICLSYTAETVPNILFDLLTTYAGINPDYIPLTDWQAEADDWLGSFTSTVILSEPDGVKDIIEEILQATGSTLWWDEIDAQIKFKIIVPYLLGQDVPVLNETQNIIAASVSVKDLEKDRLSRVVTYFNMADPVGDVDRKNFRTITIQVDTDRESENAYGIPQTKEILSRWTPSEAFAASIGNRFLYRYRETPREVTLRLDAKDATLKTGDLRDISSRLMQDVDGSELIMRMIVTEVREILPGTTYEYTFLQVAPKGGFRAALIAPDGMDDWEDASEADRKQYMFISDDHGRMSDDEPGPLIS